jgi:hypothetical protein
MNWFQPRSRRRVVPAGGLPGGRTGWLAWRKAARPIGYAGLSVVFAAAAGCSSSPGSTGPGPAATAVSPSLLASRTVPDAPVGRQLTWFLRAVADLPWSPQVIRTHFDSGFLAQLSPAEINSALEEGLPTLDASVPSSGASLIGVLWQDPARHPDSLLAVASFGRVQLAVNIAADGAGLISGLNLTPYQARRPAGPRPTATLPRWLRT